MKLKSSKDAILKKPVFFSQAVLEERSFYFENPVTNEGIAIVCGGREHCAPEYKIERESFPYLCLEWVAGGQGQLVLNGTKYPLKAGSLFTYGPGLPHKIATHSSDRLIKYFVDFRGPAALRLLRKYRLIPPIFMVTPASPGLRDLFDQLLLAGSATSRHQPRLCRLLLEALMIQATEQQPILAAGQARAYATYQRCRDYIENRLRELHRVEEVAEACHLDPAYLTRLFRRFSGENPHHFLIRLKMNAAALHLRRQGTLVKETADAFGFSDPYHFSRSFKKVHGLSPENYLRSKNPSP